MTRWNSVGLLKIFLNGIIWEAFDLIVNGPEIICKTYAKKKLSWSGSGTDRFWFVGPWSWTHLVDSGEAFSDKRESIVATRWRWDGHYSGFSTKWSRFITDIKCCFRSHLTSWLWNRKWSFGIPFCWVNLYNKFSFMLGIRHKLNWQGLITFWKILGLNSTILDRRGLTI